MKPRNRPAFGVLIFFAASFSLGLYFTFAAVQGDFGLFRRSEVVAQSDQLRAELAQLRLEVAQLENRTRRLSDDYLDLELLDEQARRILGLLRADEIVIR